MATQDSELDQLTKWREMFHKTLPTAATSKSSSEPKRPVHVDHCFAGIILDATVGVDTPWMEKIESPAYKNMSKEQLESSIQLGQKILLGEADLVVLDNRSLSLRGKGEKASGKASGKVDRGSPGKEAEKDG